MHDIWSPSRNLVRVSILSCADGHTNPLIPSIRMRRSTGSEVALNHGSSFMVPHSVEELMVILSTKDETFLMQA